MDWHIGQKIVCVNDEFPKLVGKEILPKKNCVYTIRDILVTEQEFSNNPDCRVFFLLEEIVNIPSFYRTPQSTIIFSEVYFVSRRFRPLEELSKNEEYVESIDISEFQKLLTELPILEKIE